ncbi:MAG: DUF2518 family protein [Cyanothece sp. SIO2G6]|nr:DUF2518 family protein [Cyanothece sp. SIO2G6]
MNIPTTEDFWVITQYCTYTTLAFGALSLLGFLFKWGFRFRLVGTTGFMIVLTCGAFGLSIVPFVQTTIPGSIPYQVTFDNGMSQAVIAVPPTVTESELDATLRQAALNLFSLGRAGNVNEKMIVRARTLLHPELGVSIPLYLGDVKRSLAVREDEQMAVTLYPESLAQLPPRPPEAEVLE